MNERNGWKVVARAVTQRMEQLTIDQATVARTAGLSDAFVRSMMKGTPRADPRPNNLAKLCKVLQWTPDSIDRLLDGNPPIEVNQPRVVTVQHPSTSVTNDDYLAALADIQDRNEATLRRIEALEDRLRGREAVQDDSNERTRDSAE